MALYPIALYLFLLATPIGTVLFSLLLFYEHGARGAIFMPKPPGQAAQRQKSKPFYGTVLLAGGEQQRQTGKKIRAIMVSTG